MRVKVAVHQGQGSGSVEYHGLPAESTGIGVRSGDETQRIVLEPPGIVRDTVALAIRARLTTGESRGNVEDVAWEKLPGDD